MKITALVENTATKGNVAKHGLSLYIQTSRHNILFDLGPDKTLFENAKRNNVDLSNVDIVIISHGHVDHGGALMEFLKINSKAKVYIQRLAFEKFYTKFLMFKVYIGLDQSLSSHQRLVLLDGDAQIDENLILFTAPPTKQFYSSANNSLLCGKRKDDFRHEHNLVILDEQLLISGCSHAGIVNILQRAQKYNLKYFVGGFHMYNPVSKKTVNNQFLQMVARQLCKYQHITFYTCHCTGKKAFDFLQEKMPNLHYIHCGDTITVQ